MEIQEKYMAMLEAIAGKTIGLVYIFEGETAEGCAHYAVWQADVISAWLNAIQELRCMPLIMDVRTFVHKATNNTLPHIDYVINLHNGTVSLSTLCLVPATCAFLNVPCIPCDANTVSVGENKVLSNIIAQGVGLKVPRNLSLDAVNGINRPKNFGSSIGVVRGKKKLDVDLYQEFIDGVDMTTPILYNPLTGELDTLPAILYVPDNQDPKWFLGEKEKATHSTYTKHIIHFDNITKEHFLHMAETCGVDAFCRIDCRVHCKSTSEIQALRNSVVEFDKVFFIEINPMPTIKNGINYLMSLENLVPGSSFARCLELYNTYISTPSLTGFVLSCSILAKAKH